MQAAFYTRQGPAAEVLTVADQPSPDPGLQQVRVQIHTSE
jgi:NADPH:quinone reductase